MSTIKFRAWKGSMKNKKFKIGPLQEEWLTYLETYPEQQIKSSLGRMVHGEIHACCLGIAGLIAGVVCPNEFGDLETFEGGIGSLNGDSFEAIGLYSPLGNRNDDHDDFYLAHLNDGNMTWPQIAALIRSKPEDYFKTSV